jgi:hypothetical protein
MASFGESRLSLKRSNRIPHAFALDAITELAPRTRIMFGAIAVYVADKVVLLLRDRPEHTDDNGVWIATTAKHHASLRREFPNMRSIRMHGRAETGWQVLAVEATDFEQSVLRACELIRSHDPRIGKLTKASQSSLRGEELVNPS